MLEYACQKESADRKGVYMLEMLKWKCIEFLIRRNVLAVARVSAQTDVQRRRGVRG